MRPISFPSTSVTSRVGKLLMPYLRARPSFWSFTSSGRLVEWGKSERYENKVGRGKTLERGSVDHLSIEILAVGAPVRTGEMQKEALVGRLCLRDGISKTKGWIERSRRGRFARQFGFRALLLRLKSSGGLRAGSRAVVKKLLYVRRKRGEGDAPTAFQMRDGHGVRIDFKHLHVVVNLAIGRRPGPVGLLG